MTEFGGNVECCRRGGRSECVTVTAGLQDMWRARRARRACLQLLKVAFAIAWPVVCVEVFLIRGDRCGVALENCICENIALCARVCARIIIVVDGRSLSKASRW